MTVYLPKGKPNYHYDFVLHGRRYHGSTGCRTKTAAKQVEQRAREAAALPVRTRPPITVDEAASLYQDRVEALPSWPTIRPILAALVAGLGKSRLLSEITPRDLQTHFARRRKGRANSSVNREIENARAMWRHAHTSKYDIGDMPDWKSMTLKVPRVDPRELDAKHEETALFEHLRADLHDAVRFLLLSGWRRAEVLGLRWTDISFPTKTAITRIKGGDIIKRPLTTALIEILARQPQVGPKLGRMVFTYVCQKSRDDRRQGERYPLTPTALRKAWHQALEAAGIENFRLHDLRHTRGTRIVRATGSLAAAKEALKHRSLTTTLRYAHVLDEDVRNALEASESRHSPDQTRADDQKTA